MKKIQWSGVLNDEIIGLHNATPAQALQNLLEKKWKLKKGDKDMIVMQHLFKIRNPKSETRNLISSLVVKGDDAVDTAMAKTVGLPLGIAAKLILVEELQKYNIIFGETNQ